MPLSISQLELAIPLIQEKEALETRLLEINRALKALEDGTPRPPINPVNQRRRRKRRVAMKDAILEKLKSASKDGITIQDLAKSISAKPTSVSVWLYTTGKTIKAIEKVGRGRFALR